MTSSPGPKKVKHALKSACLAPAVTTMSLHAASAPRATRDSAMAARSSGIPAAGV